MRRWKSGATFEKHVGGNEEENKTDRSRSPISKERLHRQRTKGEVSARCGGFHEAVGLRGQETEIAPMPFRQFQHGKWLA